MPEMYWTVAITANDPERYVPPTWKIIAREGDLPARVKRLQDSENVTVTKVFNERGREIPKPIWTI